MSENPYGASPWEKPQPAPQYGSQPSFYAPPPQQFAQTGPPPPAPYSGQHPPVQGYPGYGQPPYGGYGYPMGPMASTRTNGLAIASMVLGILWLWWIGSVLALIFGYIARQQIRERGEGGNGMAIAGIVLGWVGVAFFAIGLAAYASGG